MTFLWRNLARVQVGRSMYRDHRNEISRGSEFAIRTEMIAN